MRNIIFGILLVPCIANGQDEWQTDYNTYQLQRIQIEQQHQRNMREWDEYDRVDMQNHYRMREQMRRLRETERRIDRYPPARVPCASGYKWECHEEND